jgi:hypothetical protein
MTPPVTFCCQQYRPQPQATMAQLGKVHIGLVKTRAGTGRSCQLAMS